MTHSGQPRDVVILGSTGSIGTQALDIIRRNPGRFRVAALAAGGGNVDLLARQAAEFGAAAVAVASPAAAARCAGRTPPLFRPNGSWCARRDPRRAGRAGRGLRGRRVAV